MRVTLLGHLGDISSGLMAMPPTVIEKTSDNISELVTLARPLHED